MMPVKSAKKMKRPGTKHKSKEGTFISTLNLDDFVLAPPRYDAERARYEAERARYKAEKARFEAGRARLEA